MNWQDANAGPVWMPVLHAAETRHAIPANLLARIAFEESSFLPEIISGEERSSANCIGIMQLNPVYYPAAGQDPTADIETAAELLASLYARFADWQAAVAAYNWGGGNVHHEYIVDRDRYFLADMPEETQRYVKAIVADVPITGSLIPLGASHV